MAKTRPTSPPIFKHRWFSYASDQLVWGEQMSPANQPPAADRTAEDDQIDEAALADAMRTVPLGAGVLAGTAVALLVIGYLAIYLLVFLPRGTVG
jgi:hypothetical protein